MKPWFEQFEEGLVALFETSRSGMHDSMNYTLLAPGKRFRPRLMFDAFCDICDARGIETPEVLPGAVFDAAAALECIHNYSLIHDDLPCMDDDSFRRGRLTSHKVYGEALALLAGDALLNAAAELLAKRMRAELHSGDLDRMLGFADVQNCILEASGAKGMIEGQRLDIDNAGALTLEEVEHVNRLKTGALIAAAAYSGARIAGADSASAERYRDLGFRIGSMFQITDDILDVEGDPTLVGKTLAKDEKRSMATYASLLGVAGAKEKVKALRDETVRLAEEVGAKRIIGQIDYIVARRK
ncbi:MAG: polyprenyl synthetase family protein [Bacillota bacterium]|nr:polyprenyl synthetase family protein [Bacillota bacterium]